MQPSRRLVQGSKAALALVLTAGLAGACASKPGARTAAGYKVGRTGAALSAAADDPRRLAALQQRIARPGAAMVARRPASEAQARRLAAANSARQGGAVSARAGQANGRNASAPVRGGAPAALPSGFGAPEAATAPVQLGMAFAPNVGPMAAPNLATDQTGAMPAAPRGLSLPQSIGGLPTLSIGLLGALALLGLMFLALLKRLMARKRSGADLDPALPTAANDADGPSRPANRRSRSEPPPPTVTIRKVAHAG